MAIEIYSDASKTTIGGFIRQGTIGGFFNRSLTKTEMSYPPIDRELLGLHDTALFFEPLVGSAKVTLFTDQQPLLHLDKLAIDEPTNSRSPDREIWIRDLNRLNYEIRYIEGKKNIIADAMTRKPFAVDAANFIAGAAALEWTEDDWAREQPKDEHMKHWRDYLQHTCGPLDNSMAREKCALSPKGVVRRLWVPHDKATTKEAQWLIKVPNHMHNEVLAWFHNKSGHSGVTAFHRKPFEKQA